MTRYYSKPIIVTLLTLLSILLIQNNTLNAQIDQSEFARQEIKRRLGTATSAESVIGKCTCGCPLERYSRETDRECPPALKNTGYCSPSGLVIEYGYKCTNPECGRSYSCDHECHLYTNGMRRMCLYEEHIAVNGRNDVETIKITNYCMTQNTIGLTVLNPDGSERDRCTLIPGDTYTKIHPKNCLITIKTIKRGELYAPSIEYAIPNRPKRNNR